MSSSCSAGSVSPRDYIITCRSEPSRPAKRSSERPGTAMTASDEDGGVDQSGIGPLFDPQVFPPPSSTVQVTFGAQSRRGRSRVVNEDHYLVLRLGRYQETLLTSLPNDAVAARFDEYGYAMVVADGMGDVG